MRDPKEVILDSAPISWLALLRAPDFKPRLTTLFLQFNASAARAAALQMRESGFEEERKG